MLQRRSDYSGLLELHFAVLLFGFSALFGKFLTLSPLVIVLGRASFAAISLLLLLWWQGARLWPRFAWSGGWLIVTGAILALHWVSFFQAVQVSSVAVALITYSSFPLFVTLLEPWVTKERLRGLDLLTALLVLVGLICVVPKFDLSNNVTLGACWGICSGLTFGVLSLLNRRMVKECSPITLAGWQNFFAALVLAPFLPATALHMAAQEWALLAVLGILFTAVSHALFIRGLLHVRAQLAGIICALEGVYGVVFAYLILGEAPSWRTLLGGALILSAVLLGTCKRQRF